MQQGITIEDAQAAMCHGTLGRREWSADEREAACQRYEEMTGINIRRNTGEVPLMAGSVITVVLLYVVVWYVIRKRQKSKNVHRKKAH